MTLLIHDIPKRYPNGVQALKDMNLTMPAGMHRLSALMVPGIARITWGTWREHVEESDGDLGSR